MILCDVCRTRIEESSQAFLRPEFLDPEYKDLCPQCHGEICKIVDEVYTELKDIGRNMCAAKLELYVASRKK